MLTAKALIGQCICILRYEPLPAAYLGRLQTKKVKSRSYFLVGQVQGKENRLKFYRKISKFFFRNSENDNQYFPIET